MRVVIGDMGHGGGITGEVVRGAQRHRDHRSSALEQSFDELDLAPGGGHRSHEDEVVILGEEGSRRDVARLRVVGVDHAGHRLVSLPEDLGQKWRVESRGVGGGDVARHRFQHEDPGPPVSDREQPLVVADQCHRTFGEHCRQLLVGPGAHQLRRQSRGGERSAETFEPLGRSVECLCGDEAT